MINWRDVRSPEALEKFLAEFVALPWAKREPMLKQMTKYMDQVITVRDPDFHQDVVEIEAPTSRQVRSSRRKRRVR